MSYLFHYDPNNEDGVSMAGCDLSLTVIHAELSDSFNTVL